MGERPNRDYAIGADLRVNQGGIHSWHPWMKMRGKVGVERDVSSWSSEDEALMVAADNLVRALNGRTRSRRKHVYTRISGADLSEALAGLGITPTEFGIIYGTTVERVLSWIDNAEDIPHPARVLLDLLRLPGALDLARRATDEAITEKEAADA